MDVPPGNRGTLDIIASTRGAGCPGRFPPRLWLLNFWGLLISRIELTEQRLG
jgi:hypothetical protein